MSAAADALKAIESKLKEFGSEVDKELQEHLPQVESVVTAAEDNPVVQALSSAVHLPEMPEILQAVASVVNVLDAAVGAAKSAAPAAPAATAAVQAPAAAAPQAPAPVPATSPNAG